MTTATREKTGRTKMAEQYSEERRQRRTRTRPPDSQCRGLAAMNKWVGHRLRSSVATRMTVLYYLYEI